MAAMKVDTVGSNVDKKQPAHDHGENCGCDAEKKGDMRIPTIFDAIKAGMLVPVQTFVEASGPEIFNSRDEKGHTPAHWACLGGHVTILRYIIENKGPIDEASENELAQRPVHWACVNGHIALVDILLQTGVNIDTVDNKGCTPLIIACQYGHTMMAGYLMGKGARLQLTDKDGDTALHWAAFKGYNELIRLLVYSGLNPHQTDKYGQMPLHLACINGNLTSVQDMCEQDSVDINLADKNGKTPLMLAKGRKHNKIIEYLTKETKTRASLIPRIDIWAIVFGPPGNKKGPLLFFIVNMLCWAYPMYIYKCLPMTWYDLQILHIIFMILNAIMWISLYHASTINPGFLPRNIPEYDRAIKEIAHFDEWKQGQNPLSRLCHTCRTVRPMRSKHCRICNRCVKMFDHHCPYIYNCVGVENRTSFALFVTSTTIAGMIVLYLCFYHWSLDEWEWQLKYIVGIPDGIFFQFIAVFVTIGTWYHAGINLTTNERINYKRYKYLQDGKGKYYNPYDRGFKNNLLEFFHLKKPLSDDEVQYLNVTIV